jgi:opacity protein-like surface antigen
MMKKGMLFSAIILFAFMSNATAQLNFGFNGIGGKVGLIMPEGGIDNAIGFGAVADLGTFTMSSVGDIALGASLDYWAKNYSQSSTWDWTWSVISIAAYGKYFFPMESSFKPYAGLGLGFDISKWKSEYNGPDPGFGFNSSLDGSESNFDLALHLVGGATYKLSPTLDGFVEAKYTTGGIDYFGIYVGVLYKLK